MRTKILFLSFVVLLLVVNIRAGDEDEDESENEEDENQEEGTTSNDATTTYRLQTYPVQENRPSLTETDIPSEDVKCGVPFNGPPRFVVGGRSAKPFDWPWMMAILYRPESDEKWKTITRHNHKLFCGGVLLNNHHVLTAAHCFDFDDFRPNYHSIGDMEVILGEYNLDRPSGYEQTYRISKVKKHPKYVNYHTHFRNDLAILTLDRPVKFNKAIRPVCLPSHKTQDLHGLNATAIGWGDIDGDVGIEIWADVLQEVALPIMDHEECNNRHVVDNIVPEREICAAPFDGGRDTCTHDSGGPLLIQEKGRWTVIGLVSWGPEYCGIGLPDSSSG